MPPGFPETFKNFLNFFKTFLKFLVDKVFVSYYNTVRRIYEKMTTRYVCTECGSEIVHHTDTYMKPPKECSTCKNKKFEKA